MYYFDAEKLSREVMFCAMEKVQIRQRGILEFFKIL